MNNKTTIEIKSTLEVIQIIETLSKELNLTVSSVTEHLIEVGLSIFDRESNYVSPIDILKEYTTNNKLNNHMWSINSNRKLVIRIRLRANENNIELCEFSNYTIVRALKYYEAN